MSYRKIPTSVSLPEPIYNYLSAMAVAENITISHAIARGLARAFGIMLSEVDSEMNKVRKGIKTTTMAQLMLDPKAQELPADIVALHEYPHRVESIYMALGLVGCKWGNGKEVTDGERAGVRHMREKFAIKAYNRL